MWITEAFNSAVMTLAEKGFAYTPIPAEPKPWLEEDPEEPAKIPYHWSHIQDY